MAKKSSSGGAKKKKSKSKINKKLSDLNSESKKIKGTKENPFESIWSRRKFNILGKKRKDDERRRVGLARSIAFQKREKTLLKEYEQSNKSSTFKDNRIGEQNEEIGEFHKEILRSRSEQQLKLKLKKKKKNKFNLSDGEEDDYEDEPQRDDYEDDEPFYGDDKDGDLPVRKYSDHFTGKDLEVKVPQFITCMKNSWQIKKPEVHIEVMVVEGKEKGPAVVAAAKKGGVAPLVVGQKKRWAMPTWGGNWAGDGVAEYCVQNACCMAMAVRRKSNKLGGYLLTTKKHKDFWLLA